MRRITLKPIVEQLLPPVVVDGLRWLRRGSPEHQTMAKPTLEYTRAGWKPSLENNVSSGWDAACLVEAERVKWDTFCRNLQAAGPLGFSHEHDDLSVRRNIAFHNVHISFAYVLAVAAHAKSQISVLDWGGGLGHYHQLGQAVLPAVALDYHCKELPAMAAAGRQINPAVHWYDDESCLGRLYDLVMINGSLQYDPLWKETLYKIAVAVGSYLFLTRVPIVFRSPSFVAIQRIYGTEMLHQQFNQDELLAVAAGTGLRTVREFVVGDRPHIRHAPEQPELRGWLFAR